MPQERGYIPENQQVQTQPEPEQRRPHTSRLRRIVQVSSVMAAMLAVNTGFIEAAKKPNNNEPEIQPQMGTDILGGIGSFDTGSPTGWNAESTDIVPTLSSIVAFSPPNSATVETDGTLPCTSNGWITQQAYSVNPGNVYTLNFEAVYKGSESPHGINPKIILDWKNSQGQSLNTPSTYNGTAQDGEVSGSWSPNTETFGPSQNIIIPSQAAKVTVEIRGNETDPSCVGKLYVDNLALTTTSVPTPTPPASVGGIAEMPDLPPAATLSHSSKDTLVTNVEIAVGSAAALAAIGVAGAEINKRRKHRG